MGTATTIAMSFRYPSEGWCDEITMAIDGLPDGAVRRQLRKFAKAIAPLSLGEWEELHTKTLDLSPQFVPYVGHMVWGESYKRGAFMADLKRAMAAAGVDLGGELPDHLEPILRYLDVCAEPQQELVDVLPRAVDAMIKELAKSDRHNPYRHVLAAVRTQVAIESRVEIGSTR